MNKKLASFLIYFGVVALCIGCFILIVYTKNIIYFFLLGGIFFILSIAMLPIYFKRLKREYQRQKKMENDEVLEEINETQSHKITHDVYQIRTVVDTWKMSNMSDKIKSFVFVSIFLACILGCMIFISIGYILVGIICFCLGAGEIILALIIVKILEKRSVKIKKNHQYQKTTALVLGTAMSSSLTTGTKRNKNIRNITYKVYLQIHQNKIVTYSKDYYEVGDRVVVLVDEKKPKLVHILYKQEDFFEIEGERY